MCSHINTYSNKKPAWKKYIAWIEKQMPKTWRKVAADGNGVKWVDENGMERLRYMRPNGKNAAGSDWSRQENGYYRWKNEYGQDLDINGDVVLDNATDFYERVHIPNTIVN